jgi:hypothetical protein
MSGLIKILHIDPDYQTVPEKYLLKDNLLSQATPEIQ